MGVEGAGEEDSKDKKELLVNAAAECEAVDAVEEQNMFPLKIAKDSHNNKKPLKLKLFHTIDESIVGVDLDLAVEAVGYREPACNATMCAFNYNVKLLLLSMQK